MFTKDSRTENFLTSLGVSWTYTNAAKYSDLHANWRNVNLGRASPRIEDAVLSYAEQMEQGSAAPAPILWGRDWSVLDGVQRLSAGELRGYTTFSAYVVETDSDEMIQAIRVIANQRLQGTYQESESFVMQRAIDVLVNEIGWSIEQVAAIGGWKPSKVAEKKLLSDWGFAIRRIGGPQKLPDGIVKHIASVTSIGDLGLASKPIAAFLEELNRAEFSVVDAKPYVDRFFGGEPLKGKQAYDGFSRRLDAFREDEEVATRLANPRQRRYSPVSQEAKLRRALKSAITIAEEARKSEDRIYYVDEFCTLGNQLLRIIKKIGVRSAINRRA